MGYNNLSVGDIDELLKNKFTNDFRKGYVTYDGITMPLKYKELKEDIDNFEVFDDDIWICSFPKTGLYKAIDELWRIFFMCLCNYRYDMDSRNGMVIGK